MMMLAVNRVHRRGKRGIRKGTDRNRDHFRFPVRLPIDGRAANRAKVERDRVPAIGHPCKGLRTSLRLNIAASEECSDPIGAARSLLTRKTMAEGDVRWFSSAGGAQLSAGTRRKSCQSNSSCREQSLPPLEEAGQRPLTKSPVRP